MKILAVDDSFDWLNAHSMAISDVFGEDAEIVLASSAFEALNIYKSEYIETPFNLVITDLQMETDYEPLTAGEWLIKEILALKETQNILIVSSTFNIEQIADYYNVDCLSKRTIISNIDEYYEKLKNIYVF